MKSILKSFFLALAIVIFSSLFLLILKQNVFASEIVQGAYQGSGSSGGLYNLVFDDNVEITQFCNRSNVSDQSGNYLTNFRIFAGNNEDFLVFELTDTLASSSAQIQSNYWNCYNFSFTATASQSYIIELTRGTGNTSTNFGRATDNSPSTYDTTATDFSLYYNNSNQSTYDPCFSLTYTILNDCPECEECESCTQSQTISTSTINYSEDLSIVAVKSFETDASGTITAITDSYFHVPFFVWYVIFLPTMYIFTRIIIELSIRLRKKYYAK